MPEEPIPAPEEAPVPEKPAPPTKRRTRKTPAEPAAPAAAPEAPAPKKSDTPPVPKRASLDPPLARLLTMRRALDQRRPVFGRQAAHRYYRIGRDEAWRRPRGQQSKQRRHYGYRAEIVSIGYRSPARVRGMVPSGFLPVLVHSVADLEGIDGRRQAAVIGRTGGTRRRLVLEEEARKLGIRVLNPIAKTEGET